MTDWIKVSTKVEPMAELMESNLGSTWAGLLVAQKVALLVLCSANSTE